MHLLKLMRSPRPNLKALQSQLRRPPLSQHLHQRWHQHQRLRRNHRKMKVMHKNQSRIHKFKQNQTSQIQTWIQKQQPPKASHPQNQHNRNLKVQKTNKKMKKIQDQTPMKICRKIVISKLGIKIYLLHFSGQERNHSDFWYNTHSLKVANLKSDSIFLIFRL